MRVMVIIKANADSEAGILPSEKLFSDMNKFNEELVNAGLMLDGDGLQPSSKGKRVKFSGGKRIVTDGPFAETRELIAGYWVWKVNSIDEAVEWVKRIPFDAEHVQGDAEIEIRPFYEVEDLGPEYTPELKEKEERIRAKAAKLKNS